MNRTLPTGDSKAVSDARKEIPLYRGCRLYFPAALALIAANSKKGNDKHNAGEPMHHARGKSSDHPDCVERHMTDIGDLLAIFERIPLEGEPADDWENKLREELGQFGWRALAWIQETAETYLGYPLAPAARLPQMAKAPTKECTCGVRFLHPDRAAVSPSHSMTCPLSPPIDLSPKRQIPLHQRPLGPCECGDPLCDGTQRVSHPAEPC